MIKTKNLAILFLLLPFGNVVHAQSSEDLFKKVFGKTQESKTILIDATLGEFLLGSVTVTLAGDKIQTLSGLDLERLLISRIRDEKKSLYAFGDKQIEPGKLPFKITYSPVDLRVALDIPVQDFEAQSSNLFDDLIPYFSRQSVAAAPFSYGVNYKLEEVQSHNLNQQSYFQAHTDSFTNIKSVSIENQMNYLSSRKSSGSNGWYRQNSRMIYDRPHRMQRVEMGDVTFPILGYQQSRSLGGVSFYRDFSLNPYRSTGATSSFEYEIETRSLVRTYINNSLLKTEYMNAGRYLVKDIPLNNGVNRIVVDITDELGKKRILIFNEAGSVDLLSAGVSRYSLSAGYPSTDEEFSKKYQDKNGGFYSGFYQHGMNRNWSAGSYLQGNKNYHLLGASNIFATQYGNISLDVVGSKNKEHAGPAAKATYQLNLFGSRWYDTHTFTSKIEYRSPWFNELGENTRNRFDYLASSNYSVPLLQKFNVAVGGNYQKPRSGSTAKFGFDTSVSSRLFEEASLTFYYARSRDENRFWSTQLYLFLNISFGESGNFASAFYEKNAQTKRLNVIHDNGKKLNNLKASAIVDDNMATSNGSLDLQYNTALADVGIREELIHTKRQKTGNRTSLRFMSSFAYVHNGEESGFSISRPISNSFVIFKPNKDWKGQTFGVQTAGDNDTVSGLFGESLVSGLTAYQYRRLQLDPSLLEPGHILGQESFVVYPHYRSGHLFTVGKSGLLVVRGILLDKNLQPQPLKVGFWTSETGKTTPFFTSREGEFFLEGIEASKGKIQLDGEDFEAKEVNLEKNKSGLIDIGSIVLPYKESRL